MHKPLLIMLSGLPGCGKSTVARALMQRLPALQPTIVASDQVRKTLFPQPTYSDEENRVAHQAVQDKVLAHLRNGRTVIHDATHLKQAHRRWRHEAERLTGCRAVLIAVQLDEATTKSRLAARQLHNNGWSDADFSVYQLMLESAETIQSPHLTIETQQSFSDDIDRAVASLRTLHAATTARVSKQKAFCYITRGDQLLVFEHTHAPEAGIQVPAGTVELAESAESAALREASEESGLLALELIDALGTQVRDMHDYGKNELHQRTFFHLNCTQSTANRWQHWEEFSSDGGRYCFDFRWVDLENVPPLVADHDLFIERLRAGSYLA